MTPRVHNGLTAQGWEIRSLLNYSTFHYFRSYFNVVCTLFNLNFKCRVDREKNKCKIVIEIRFENSQNI